MIDKQAVYPSVRRILEQHIGCREPRTNGAGKGWAIYWSEGGAELTLYPGDEGPQEASSIGEMLGWLGGDQPAQLNPGTVKYLESLPEDERARILAAISE